MTTDTPVRAAIYARISQNPRDEAHKTERQIEACLAHMRGSYDLVLDPVTGGHFVDDGISASKQKKRPAYDRLLDMVRDGEVDVVITYNVDRMLRSVEDMVAFIKLAHWGPGVEDWCSIEAVKGQTLDLATPGGRMVAQILASVAQHETELKSARHVTENQRKRRAGERLGGPVPFGWTKSKERPGWLVEHPEEGPALRDAVRWRVHGDDAPNEGQTVSIAEVGRRWNERGLRTRRGGTWSQNNVRKVLVRPMNAGLQSRRVTSEAGWGTDRFEVDFETAGQWDALCSVEDWRELTSQASGRARPAGRPAETMLTGRLECGLCGGKLSGNTDSRGRALYKCLLNSCGLQVDREAADVVVRNAVRLRVAHNDLSVLAPRDGSMERAATYREEIAAATTRQRDLEEQFVAGRLEKGVFERAHDEAGATVERARDRLERIEEANAWARLLGGESVRERFREGSRSFDAMPVRDRRLVVAGLFPRIVVSTAYVGGTRLPARDRVKLYLPDGSEHSALAELVAHHAETGYVLEDAK